MTALDDIKAIKQIDKENMLEILLNLPRQCRDAVDIADGFKAPSTYGATPFNKIFFAAVGGSAIGADIVRTYLSSRLRLPVLVSRNYGIPAFVDKKTLAFVSSYSGDTEETLSAYGRIRRQAAKIIIITSGGRLYELAKKDAIPCILIPKGIPPRAAIGYMTIIPLVVFSKMGFIKRQDADLKEMINVIEEFKEKILRPQVAAPKNIAKEIAQKIYDKFVIIYAGEDFLGGVATRWRQELEENAKILCASAVLPEMNHNEITGWEDPRRISRNFAVIFLRDKDEHPRVSRRIEISRDLIKRKTRNVIEIKSAGKSLLARTFSLVYTGTFASFYLAVLNRVDPTPVGNVAYLKRQLANK